MKLTILYEDQSSIVVVKPANLLTMGDKTGDDDLLSLLRRHIAADPRRTKEPFVGLVHRLDRPVGGVMVVAKTPKGAAKLSKKFRERKVTKEYCAIVTGLPEPVSGRLKHYLVKDREKNRTRALRNPGRDAKEAILDYAVVTSEKNQSLLAVTPVTGRSHQIRVQLAAIGHPIVGDIKYGAPTPLSNRSILLYATALTIILPGARGERIFRAPLPSLWPLTL